MPSGPTYQYGPDSFGALSIPLSAKDPALAAGDPALTYIGDYLVHWLVNDGNVGAQWQIAGVAPNQPPVVTMTVGAPDDEGYSFDVKQLPALFIFREGGREDWWGDDWGVDITTVKILWVLPIGMPLAQRSRLPFLNAMAKAVHDGVEIGRTPSWVQPNDPDSQALTQGSLFYTYAGFVMFNMKEWKRAKVRTRAASGKGTQEFPALEMTFEMVERLTFGVTNRANLNTSSQSAQITITDANTGNTLVVGGTKGPPTITSISPTFGTQSGGTSVTITGTLFSPGAVVMFGPNRATNVVVVSATSITCTAPAGAFENVVPVTVTNQDTQTASYTGFTYTA